MKMIGLEYVLRLWDITQQELADKLEIKRQNIDAWIRGKRKIPQKHIPRLSEIFKGIPQEYFQKELTDIEKIEIQKIKVLNEAQEIEYQDNFIDRQGLRVINEIANQIKNNPEVIEIYEKMLKNIDTSMNKLNKTGN